MMNKQEYESVVDLRNKLVELITKHTYTMAFVAEVPSLRCNIYDMLESLDEIIDGYIKQSRSILMKSSLAIVTDDYSGPCRRRKKGRWTIYSIPRNMGKSWIQKQYNDFYRILVCNNCGKAENEYPMNKQQRACKHEYPKEI